MPERSGLRKHRGAGHGFSCLPLGLPESMGTNRRHQRSPLDAIGENDAYSSIMPAERTACACTTLRKASRAVTRFYDEALRPTDLTATQFAVMRAVEREKKVPMSHVARTLVMDRTTFYRAIAPLLRAGDLRWAPSAGDGRAKWLQLSASGRRRMNRAAGRWAAAQRRMVEKIGLARWRELSRWLSEATEEALALQPSEAGGTDDLP